MTSRATMELAWNPKPGTGDSPDEASAYLDQWCREEFGEKAAGALEKYYNAYFQAPAKYAPPDDARLGDHLAQLKGQPMPENVIVRALDGGFA